MTTASLLPEGKQFRWFMVGWLLFIFLSPIAAWYTFSWLGLAALVALFIKHGWFGICACYHRILVHGSARIKPWVLAYLLFWGTTAGQGPWMKWGTKHRQHHQYSDEPDDPHSPHHHGGLWSGLFFAHAGWLAWNYEYSPAEWQVMYARYIPDWKDDPVVRWFSVNHGLCHAITICALLAAGWFAGGWPMAVSLFVWGWWFRIFCVSNVTWAVNSWAHIPSLPFNYRNAHNQSGDHSCNNPVVAFAAGGEGWHANHHSVPSAANHGQIGWKEKVLDPTYWMILRPLRFLGLASSLKKYDPVKEELVTI